MDAARLRTVLINATDIGHLQFKAIVLAKVSDAGFEQRIAGRRYDLDLVRDYIYLRIGGEIGDEAVDVRVLMELDELVVRL